MLSNKEILNIRNEFPILKRKIYGNQLIYLDNAATTQKPNKVIKSIVNYYSNINSNVHRGLHYLSQLSTSKMENSRKKFQKFINANSSNEIIFTKNATEAINIVAHSIICKINKGDEIIISNLEHHSNIIPWQILCNKIGAILKIIKFDISSYYLDIKHLESILSKKTKIVAICHISNALGIINPIKKIIKKVHQYNALILIDGAQAPSHIKIDVKDLDSDFYVFSSHKMYGPTGVGILYGKEYLLNEMIVYQSGGEMIKEVNYEKTIYQDTPLKFEAGTPNIEGIIASKEAIKFIEKIGIQNIKLYESELIKYAINLLNNIDDIILYVNKDIENISNIISFNIKNIHPFDIGSILNKLGISVRVGHHCTQPLMNFLKIPGTIRISLAIYNTFDEIKILYNSILKAKKILS